MSGYSRRATKQKTEGAPEWVSVLFLGEPLPARLWAALKTMRVHLDMPVITNDGNNCSAFVNPQNKTGLLRLFWVEYSGRYQPQPKSQAYLDSDVMSHAFAKFSSRSRDKDAKLSEKLKNRLDWLARPPEFPRNLMGECMAPAYQSIKGADFLQGYHLLGG